MCLEASKAHDVPWKLLGTRIVEYSRFRTSLHCQVPEDVPARISAGYTECAGNDLHDSLHHAEVPALQAGIPVCFSLRAARDVINLVAFVVVFVVVAASVEVHPPPPRSPWPRQSKGSDMICRMLRWTLRKERSLMQPVLASVAFGWSHWLRENDGSVGPCVGAPGRKSEFKNGRSVCEAVEGSREKPMYR
jgi:hypothetical protein